MKTGTANSQLAGQPVALGRKNDLPYQLFTTDHSVKQTRPRNATNPHTVWLLGNRLAGILFALEVRPGTRAAS